MSLQTTKASSTLSLLALWDFPQSALSVFPRSDIDHLSGEKMYHMWATCMQTAFEVCRLQDIVNEAIIQPLSEDASEKIWLKMNASVRAVILQCISNNLVTCISHLYNAKDMWDHFSKEYSQAGTGSIIYWFSQLYHIMQSDDDVAIHTMAFQDAYCHLANSKFIIPELCVTRLLLSTLYSGLKDPSSWDFFVKGNKRIQHVHN